MLDRKRKRGGLTQDEISVFSSMTETVKEVEPPLGRARPLTSTLTNVIMKQGGFNDEGISDPTTLEALAVRESMAPAEDLNLHGIHDATHYKGIVDDIK
ncbi:Katanin p80 WD40 repeat-containing subunit B1 [Hordeum vulgare]|nr:Katanin p80 WD40 repeat-containing subunit B1 [Hordeum vulgare]